MATPPRGPTAILAVAVLALLLVSSSSPASATFSKDEDSKCEWRSVIDNFDGGENYANNDGTHHFASSWKESDPHGGGASSGSVQVRCRPVVSLYFSSTIESGRGLKVLWVSALPFIDRAASSIC